MQFIINKYAAFSTAYSIILLSRKKNVIHANKQPTSNLLFFSTNIFFVKSLRSKIGRRMTSVRKSLLSIWRKRMLVAQRIALTGRKSFVKRSEELPEESAANPQRPSSQKRQPQPQKKDPHVHEPASIQSVVKDKTTSGMSHGDSLVKVHVF